MISPKKWHESLTEMVGVVLFAAVLTSPCWGLALIVWATR